MFECPLCHKPTFSAWSKAKLGPASSACCPDCGGEVSVPLGRSMLLLWASILLVFGITVLLPAVHVGRDLPLWARALVTIAVPSVGFAIYLYTVPLVRRPGPFQR